MKSYFSFGQCHSHVVGNVHYDKDCIVEIEAEDPRQVMFDTFGRKWSMQYDELPDMSLYRLPRHQLY